MTFYECFQAAATLLGADAIDQNQTIKEANHPLGCSVMDAGTKRFRVFFNELASSTACSVAARCVCPKDPTPFGQARGALLYHATNQSADMGNGKAAYFEHKCASWPATNLLEQR